MTAVSQPETVEKWPRTAALPPSHARTLLISMNPRAGFRARHEHVSAIRKSLETGGYDVRMVTELDGLRHLATDLNASGELRAVLAVGGDGTASIVRSNVPLEVPLLPVPMGTENLLGRHVGQLATPEAVTQS